jgi:hypothetical protein
LKVTPTFSSTLSTNLSATGVSGGLAYVTVVPNLNAYGTNDLSVKVEDKFGSTTVALETRITFVNQRPSFGKKTTQGGVETNRVELLSATMSPPLIVEVNDVEGNEGTLAVYGTSDNPAVIPNSGILVSPGPDPKKRTITLVPTGNTPSGTAGITLYVYDTVLTNPPSPLTNTTLFTAEVKRAGPLQFANPNTITLQTSANATSTVPVNVTGRIEDLKVTVNSLRAWQ